MCGPTEYNVRMHRFDDIIVQGGKIVISDLPYPDGQHVRVLVATDSPQPRRSIEEVRQLLRGSVSRYDEPFEPMIPADHWEMTK